MEEKPKNVLGTELQSCCFDPLTGFYRDGFCQISDEDVGTHIVCAVMTDEFLKYSKSKGNDLSTPIPEWHFPGLLAGDRWCLCVLRWLEAEEAGMAPDIVLEATHEKVLEYTDFEVLLAFKF